MPWMTARSLQTLASLEWCSRVGNLLRKFCELDVGSRGNATPNSTAQPKEDDNVLLITDQLCGSFDCSAGAIEPIQELSGSVLA